MWWKWSIIGLHSVVQAFMVLALERGNGIAAMSEQCAKAWLEAYHKGERLPKERMDTFPSLYKKIKSSDVEGYVDSRKFKASAEHDYAMEKLNELRNEFVHFMPKSWAIELSGLPDVCLRSLEVARFLAFESNTILWHNAETAESVQSGFTQLEGELRRLAPLSET